MIKEADVLSVVAEMTQVEAYFFEGSLFLKTHDSKIATEVFDELYERITPALAYGKVGNGETVYDFIACDEDLVEM